MCTRVVGVSTSLVLGRAASSYSSDMECGPVLSNVRERAQTQAAKGTGGVRAIVPVFYRLVMH